MNYVARQKRGILLATFLSILCVSVVASPQVGASPLSDLTDALLGRNQQPQNTNQPRNTPQNVVPQVTPQQTNTPQRTTTITPTTPTQTTPAETTPQQTTQQSTATTRQAANTTPVAQAAATPIDTSADVITTVNSQSGNITQKAGSPYVSNKLDPEVAELLLFAGIGSITAGVLVYMATLFPFAKPVRHISVKSM